MLSEVTQFQTDKHCILSLYVDVSVMCIFRISRGLELVKNWGGVRGESSKKGKEYTVIKG